MCCPRNPGEFGGITREADDVVAKVGERWRKATSDVPARSCDQDSSLHEPSVRRPRPRRVSAQIAQLATAGGDPTPAPPARLERATCGLGNRCSIR